MSGTENAETKRQVNGDFFETLAYTLFAGFVSLIVFLGKHLAARQ